MTENTTKIQTPELAEIIEGNDVVEVIASIKRKSAGM